MQRPKVQTAYKGKQMLSLSAVQKELENPNNSETVKLLCETFIKERTLCWSEKCNDPYVYLGSKDSVYADILRYDRDETVYYAHYAKGDKQISERFYSLDKAIEFLTREYEEMDFIVLPPDFEV